MTYFVSIRPDINGSFQLAGVPELPEHAMPDIRGATVEEVEAELARQLGASENIRRKKVFPTYEIAKG